jgi:UDP:flavonoid glycosyltransferase YjiC (YdhE family)
VPPLSIVIMIVGSRGDVQPFIPIGRRLAERHRVRIATHREFRSLVEQAGLEFYPLGGDPHALMEYIVKTGGRIVPTRLDQIIEDVPKKRAMIAEILASTWRACTEADPERPDAPAFQADLIIANPTSYGHIHCAEALHVPLHMVFTMPWSATAAVPHPFAGIEPGVDHPVQNFLSYGVVDLLIWGGIADLVNTFREETLKLPPIALGDGAALLDDNEVPYTYLWPPSLVPKPADWGPHIDLANFTFYDQARTYEPPPALLDFLAAGEAPIYVGFGSVVVEDPAALRRIVFTALEKAGARGIVSDGWAHLGGEAPPPNVFLIGDAPHDWLFAHCRAAARGAADGRGAVLRRPVLLGACRRRCRGRAGADSHRPARQRRARRGLRELPAPVGARARGRPRRRRARDRRRGARGALGVSPSSHAGHVLFERSRPSGCRLLRHVREAPLPGLCSDRALRARRSPVWLCRLECALRARAHRGYGRADRGCRQGPAGGTGGDHAEDGSLAPPRGCLQGRRRAGERGH